MTDAPGTLTVRPATLAEWLLSDRRAMALVAALGANLLLNVVNVVPYLGPIVEGLGDIGFEGIALLIATSILRRDGKPLKVLGILGALSVLKTGLDVLNLVPELGSAVEAASELGIDLTQLWFLKEAVTASPRALPPAAAPAPPSSPA